jgi:hypothetical protein
MPKKSKTSTPNKKSISKNVLNNKNKIHIFIDNSKKTVKRKRQSKQQFEQPKAPPSINIINQTPQLIRGHDDDLKFFAQHYNRHPAPQQRAPVDFIPESSNNPIGLSATSRTSTPAPPAESSSKKSVGRPKGSLNKEKVFAHPVEESLSAGGGIGSILKSALKNFSLTPSGGGGGSVLKNASKKILFPSPLVSGANLNYEGGGRPMTEQEKKFQESNATYSAGGEAPMNDDYNFSYHAENPQKMKNITVRNKKVKLKSINGQLTAYGKKKLADAKKSLTEVKRDRKTILNPLTPFRPTSANADIPKTEPYKGMQSPAQFSDTSLLQYGVKKSSPKTPAGGHDINL